jgi:uncharacterized protein YcfJ
MEPSAGSPIIAATQFWRTSMKPLIVCAVILGVAFSCPTAEAKGCIKGAIVGGLAGHLAGHGKVGAVAGCIIGHHEANKQDATKADRKSPPSTPQGNRI